MPILDAASRTVALGCIVGPDRATIAPDTFDVSLFIGDPSLDGVEVADTTEVDDGLGGTEFVANGYAPGVADSDDFTFDGEIATVLVTFPAPTAEYPETVTHWLMKAGVDRWFAGELLEPLDVTGPGDPFVVACSQFIENMLDLPEE